LKKNLRHSLSTRPAPMARTYVSATGTLLNVQMVCFATSSPSFHDLTRISGKFVATPCADTLTCQALPLVNSAGTSVTCDTASDAATRIANTGAKRTTLELARYVLPNTLFRFS